MSTLRRRTDFFYHCLLGCLMTKNNSVVFVCFFTKKSESTMLAIYTVNLTRMCASNNICKLKLT